MPPAPLPGRFGSPHSDRHRFDRHRHLATLGIGIGAAVAVVAGILLLANAGSGPGPATSSTSAPQSLASAIVGCCKALPVAARPAQRSMVALEVSTKGGVGQGCGVAVAPGGLVATTADAVAGATAVTAVTVDGRRVKARVMAVDRDSDLAVLRVQADLPVAPMADDSSVAAGRTAVVVAVAARPHKGARSATIWSTGTVRSVATAVQGGDAAGMASLTTGVTEVPEVPGSALLAPGGQVLGILDATGRPMSGGGEEVFLPTQLVVGVARALAEKGVVDHGWLDVKGHNAPPRSVRTTSTTVAAPATSTTTAPATSAGDPAGSTVGALITSVQSTGASAHSLQPGDVVVAVDGAPVRSMAELRTRLYVLGPGTSVRLAVDRGGTLMEAAVTLAASP
ncbi:MAG TPA: S1C family serine protease [Acidimicrobiales bacterium]|nr:S1C family serine protease [Acidimicrobiales bacterium]